MLVAYFYKYVEIDKNIVCALCCCDVEMLQIQLVLKLCEDFNQT